MPADIAISGIASKAEDGLHGTMTVVTQPAIVVPSVVRIERVLRLAYRIRFWTCATGSCGYFSRFGTVGLIRRGRYPRLSLSVEFVP